MTFAGVACRLYGKINRKLESVVCQNNRLDCIWREFMGYKNQDKETFFSYFACSDRENGFKVQWGFALVRYNPINWLNWEYPVIKL